MAADWAYLLYSWRNPPAIPILRSGGEDHAGGADRGSNIRIGHAVFVRHDRSAEGNQESADRRPHRSADDAVATGPSMVSYRFRHGLSFTSSALPCGTA